MKLCAYTDSDYFSGAERVLAEVVSGLPEFQWQLVVNPAIADKFRSSVPAVACKPNASRAKLRVDLIVAFWRFLKNEKPELCLVNMQTPFANTYFLVAAALAGIPVVTIWHLPQERTDLTGVLAPLKLLAYRLAIGWSKKVVTVSHWHKRVLTEQFNCPSQKITVIANGVRPARKPKTNLPTSNQVTLVSVGTLEERKGQAFLLKAIGQLKEDFRLFIVGSGPDEQLIRQTVEQLGLSQKVHVEGYQTDTPKYYAGSNLLIHPAFAENLSMVILDALAYGLPVIAHNVGGNNEMVVTGENGWLVQPGDATGWQRAVSEALKTDLTAYSKASKARYDKYYTLDTMITNYRNLLRSLA